jgi:hypothetical protein
MKIPGRAFSAWRPRPMMPENYKGWSANVNLISYQFSRSIAALSDGRDPPHGPSGNLLCPTLNPFPICLSANDIGRNNYRSVTAEFGVFKPTFWRQKNKNQD